MSLKVGELVEATVFELREGEALVRWDGGEGILPLRECTGDPWVGQRLLLKVIAVDESGTPTLSQAQVTDADRELYEFQREAERMRRVLRERQVQAPGKKRGPREAPIEERLARWISEAQRSLERLRRRRGRYGKRR